MFAWKAEPILVIDTETTGIRDTDRVVELALALMQQGTVLWACTWRVNPGIPIPAAASQVHGIYDADVADAPQMVDLVDLVGLCMDHRTCAAYNAPFDRSMLAREFQRCGAELPPEFWADAMVLAKHFNPAHGKGMFKLDAVCSRLRIDLGEAAHTATADAVAAGKIIHYYAEQLPDDLQEFASMHAQWEAQQQADWERYCARVGRDPGPRR